MAEVQVGCTEGIVADRVHQAADLANKYTLTLEAGLDSIIMLTIEILLRHEFLGAVQRTCHQRSPVPDDQVHRQTVPSLASAGE